MAEPLPPGPLRGRIGVALAALIAREVSRISRHYDELILLSAEPARFSALVSGIECERRSHAADAGAIPLPGDPGRRRLLLLPGNLNHHPDAQELLGSIRARLARGDRVCAIVYNSYLRWFFQLGNLLGLRDSELPRTFLTHQALRAIARLSGLEIVRARPVAYLPFRLFGLGSLLNRLLAACPGIRWLGIAEVLVLRPLPLARAEPPSLSVIIPVRNERGNIEAAVREMPVFPAPAELIFVEGGSSDGSWEEILRVRGLCAGGIPIQAIRQQGRGKCDAVRAGFAAARNELLVILDGDLTVPPGQLLRFYSAYVEGLGDFVQGNRLVYPMENGAMRFLNWLGNIFFAKSLSAVLDSSLGDSLCGSKLVSRADYLRCSAWRRRFGDFDPFGDFELLFPAAELALGIVEIPVRYRARSYGSTQIHRFRHGWELLRMTWIGLRRIRMG